MADQPAPIIVIKKVSGHGGHHGGAWKVAYADFVTAMMALFIVLWLMNSSVQVKKAISAYFQDPSGSGKFSGSSAAGTGEAVSVSSENMKDLKDMLEQALKKSPEMSALKDYLKMSVTGEGLRVELLESEKGMFFQSGSSDPNGLGEEVIIRLAQELAKLPNQLLIEGHTDAKPFHSRENYSNWELSTDRANAARRLMEANGIPHGKIIEVRGFADINLRDPANPEAASNRRISVIVRYQNAVKTDDEADAEGKNKEGKPADGAKEEGPAAEPAIAEQAKPEPATAEAKPEQKHH